MMIEALNFALGQRLYMAIAAVMNFEKWVGYRKTINNNINTVFRYITIHIY